MNNWEKTGEERWELKNSVGNLIAFIKKNGFLFYEYYIPPLHCGGGCFTYKSPSDAMKAAEKQIVEIYNALNLSPADIEEMRKRTEMA